MGRYMSKKQVRENPGNITLGSIEHAIDENEQSKGTTIDD